MSYSDLSTTFKYKTLLKYSMMDALAENDKEMYISGNFAFSPAKIRYTTLNIYGYQLHDQDVSYYVYAGQYAGAHPADTASAGYPVHLPHGAIITKIKSFYYNSSPTAVNAVTTLCQRVLLTDGTINSMSNTSSLAGMTGNYSVETTTIDYATISNTTYSYLILTYIYSVDIYYRGSEITYTITSPHP